VNVAGVAALWWVFLVPLRPYVPPALEPDPPFVPPEVTRVEIIPPDEDWDIPVLARPRDTAPLFGSIGQGTRVGVRGELAVPSSRYCGGSVFYAIEPFGWICGEFTRPTDQPLTTTAALSIEPGATVPYRYVMVVVPEGDFLPMWSSVEALRAYAEPERQLSRGDTVALAPLSAQTLSGGGTTPALRGGASSLTFEDKRYYITVDGKVLPTETTFQLKNYSEWQGVALSAADRLPFAWVTPRSAKVYDQPKGTAVEQLPRRTRVDVLEEVLEGKHRWVRIADARWMRADQLNEVRRIPRPEGAGSDERWIDIDLGEQVVVAYVREQPVFATLTSSGRPPNRTPRGNYPVWGRASAVTMKSQDYDDKPYYVNRVPWVVFFQAHNALHAAYWHDRFGTVKSHGCANLSPKDARYLFEWLEPRMPPGWTGLRNWDLTPAPVVHVRDSSRSKPFVQERNVGPPDKEDEAKRMEQAIARRAAQAAAEAQLAAQAGAIVSGAPAPVPSASTAGTMPFGSAAPATAPPGTATGTSAVVVPAPFPMRQAPPAPLGPTQHRGSSSQ
jgi:hypothetical protein